MTTLELLAQWNLYTNTIITVAIFVSLRLLLFDKRSLVYQLSADLLSKESWTPETLPDLGHFIRSLVTASTTLASIALATVAFIATGLANLPEAPEKVVGIVMLLLSSVLFFWIFGFTITATLAVRNPQKFELVIKVLKMSYFLNSIATLLFFVGLLWAISIINPLYSIITAIGYFVLIGAMVAIDSGKRL
ncbi:MAG: hypothetical protein ACREAY_05785 [Nitrososphaera sp.]|uniref:hypothetical protein n=1 Tax=Nitrososphaera sp. TaxID=1971748 RepID=UPI003D6E1068